MSIYTTSISRLSASDLQGLLTERAVENVRLEFDSGVPNKDETLKKLSAFANTYGGFVVLGARANSVDGRIQDLPGVDEQPGYKQKLVHWCFDGASPPLTVEVSDPLSSPSGSGKVCYVIYTPESDLAPHFLNGRKGVWVRTDEFSARFEARLANEADLRHLFDRRELVVDRREGLIDRAMHRFGRHLALRPSDTTGKHPMHRAHFELSVVPRFPARQLCEPERLREHIQRNLETWRGVLFPNPASPILSQHESAIALDPTRRTSIFEVNTWGLLFYGTRIVDNHGGTEGVHLYEFVGLVLLFLRHADRMLRALSYSGPLLLNVALGWILQAPWLRSAEGGQWVSSVEGSKLDDKVAFSLPTTAEELRSRPDGLGMEILRYVLLAVNAPDLVDAPEKLRNLIRQGYHFNSWPQPDSLNA